MCLLFVDSVIDMIDLLCLCKVYSNLLVVVFYNLIVSFDEFDSVWVLLELMVIVLMVVL